MSFFSPKDFQQIIFSFIDKLYFIIHKIIILNHVFVSFNFFYNTYLLNMYFEF